eukprot:m.84202 g.84202  ORF g.84202 m.84202 type:complete len:805 (+) comp19696_c0_seq2:199-2613(+)
MSAGTKKPVAAKRRSNVVAMVTDPNKAAAKGQLDQLQGLTTPQLIAARDRRGWCALHHAAFNGKVDATILLSKADGLLAVEDKDRCTALHRAVKHPECVRVLLQCSPSTVHDVINLQSKIGCTPLCLAAATGSIESVRMLLDAEASVSLTDKRAFTALSHAASGGHTEIVALLLQQPGVNPDQLQVTSQGNPLILAARSGRMDVLTLLMDASGDVNIKVLPEGATPLWEAAAAGHADIVAALVGRGASVTSAVTKPPSSVTAIYAACAAGHASVIRALLERMSATGARTSYLRLLKRQCGREKLTALHAAAAAGHVNVVELLLEAEGRIESAPQPLERAKSAASMFSAASTLSKVANVAEGRLLEALDSSGRTALHIAAASSTGAPVVSILLSAADTQGLPLLGVDDKGRSPVHAAAEAGTAASLRAMLDVLVTEGQPATAGSGAGHVDYKGESALVKACRAGHVECALVLLDAYAAGPDGDTLVNRLSDGPDGTTALIECVRANHVDVCKAMLEHALPQATPVDASGWSALHTAAYHGGLEVLALLLARGLEVDAGGGRGDANVTALHRACCHDHPEAVAQLVAAGADPRRKDSRGWTALHHAAAIGVAPNQCVAALLAEHGLEIGMIDNEGSTALHTAAAAAHVEFCRYLLKDHAADVAATDSKGRTALHVACAAGSTPLVEAFKAASSNFLKLVNTVDAAGQTALFSAVAVGAVDIVQILLESGGRVDAKDNAGATVLHLVVRRHVERRRDGIDYLQLAVILLRKGAAANEADKSGKTPFELALESKDAAAVHCFQGGYAA